MPTSQLLSEQKKPPALSDRRRKSGHSDEVKSRDQATSAPARAKAMPTPKLRQRVRNDGTLAQGDDRAIVLHRRIATQEVLAGSSARHDTPPSQASSPFFSHSSLPDAEVKAVKPKFRDPVSRETWSGRGTRPPLWVKRVMAERGWSAG